jgi:glycerophosphoryl diester phosphodiesterase
MWIYGHRGSTGTEPENTERAFAVAVAAEADGVEFDVRATADGVPVILHDRALARTTSGRGNVDELTLDQVRAVDAGQGQRVPTLVEVLDGAAGQLRLDLEVKQAGVEDEVLAILGRYPEARWAISSFDWAILRAVRERDSGAPLWPLAVRADDALFAVARELAAPTVALAAEGMDGDVARRCRAAGLAIMVWTVNEVEEARRVRELGAAALCTDFPEAIRAGLRGEDVP